jgi:hypothetical protein
MPRAMEARRGLSTSQIEHETEGHHFQSQNSELDRVQRSIASRPQVPHLFGRSYPWQEEELGREQAIAKQSTTKFEVAGDYRREERKEMREPTVPCDSRKAHRVPPPDSSGVLRT